MLQQLAPSISEEHSFTIHPPSFRAACLNATQTQLLTLYLRMSIGFPHRFHCASVQKFEHFGDSLVAASQG
jgi:hypothetical protein